MPIDFSEEPQRKIELATCSQHNLKYDPQITWGCVLCRKNQKKRISGYLIVGIILIIFAGIFFASQFFASDKNDDNAFPMPSIGKKSSSDVNKNLDKIISRLVISDDFEKNLKDIKYVETCLENIDKDSSTYDLDCALCVNKFEDVVANFSGGELYHSGVIPEYDVFVEGIENNQELIEKCVKSASYNFIVRAKVDGNKGELLDLAVSTYNLNVSQSFCIKNLFESISFPKSNDESYIVTLKLNSELLSLHKHDEAGKRKEEFKAYLEAQRKNETAEEVKNALLQERSKRNEQGKSEILNAKQ